MENSGNIYELLEESVQPIRSNEIIHYMEKKRNEALPVTVILTTDDNEVFEQSYTQDITFSKIKDELGQMFQVSPLEIEISNSFGVLFDNMRLCDVNYDNSRTLNFCLEFKAYECAITTESVSEMPNNDGSLKNVSVNIENKAILKPYLGGYIHRILQTKYHHGYTQTGPPEPKVPACMRNHRDTQTYQLRNRKVSTNYSQATQMQNSNIYIPNVTDRIITPGPYETADEREARIDILGKVRTIQRYFRAWKMRKILKEMSEDYKKMIALELEEEKYLSKVEDERKKHELIGKVYPRTKTDFYMLYKMVENWKKAELKQIKEMSCGPSKIAAMYLVLQKEVEMLQSIEKQKEAVRRDQKVAKDLKFLKAISQPISWNSDYKNIYIEMDTLKTQKGREYYKQYQSVCDNSQGLEARLKAYLDVKMSLENHTNCEVGLEVVNLIERACVLISHGFSDKQLEILHKRIEATMLRHLRITDCCEGVALRESKVRKQLMYFNIFYCNGCKKFKTSDKFEISTKTVDLKICTSCSWNDRVVEPWIDIRPYRNLLKTIRREERRHSSPSSIAFVLTDKDIHYIIMQIWSCHSAINECEDIYKLRLCRFFKDEDWAPWNCILLTQEESKVHLNIRHLKSVYNPEFLAYIHHKHVLSKFHFKHAIKLYNYFQDVGQIKSRWDEIIDKKEYVRTEGKPKVYLNKNIG